jgi:hypothetical protein
MQSDVYILFSSTQLVFFQGLWPERVLGKLFGISNNDAAAAQGLFLWRLENLFFPWCGVYGWNYFGF